jgi:hypothetical protein
MLDPISKPATIAAGATEVITLTADARRLHTNIAVTSGTAGTLTFKTKLVNGQLETPSGTASIDIATRKHILFNGAALEAIEVTNGGASPVTINITQV